MKSLQTFLQEASQTEKDLYEVLQIYSKSRASVYVERYELANTVREIIAKEKIKRSTIRQVAELCGLSRSLIDSVLFLTKNVSLSEYDAMYRQAEKNGVVLHWSHVLQIIWKVKDKNHRDTLFDNITNEQLTLRELNGEINALIGVNVPKKTQKTQIEKQDSKFTTLQSHLVNVRSRVDELSSHLVGLTRNQQVKLLDDIEMFLIEFDDMHETDIPKLQKIRNLLERKLNNTPQQEQIRKTAGKNRANWNLTKHLTTHQAQ